MNETPNEQLFRGVNGDSGVTANQLVEQKLGKYEDKNAGLTGAPFKQNDTHNPFKGAK